MDKVMTAYFCFVLSAMSFPRGTELRLDYILKWEEEKGKKKN
jgi:hypothetical protein